ncbi:MAG: hypothetical protein M3Q47_13915 [Actinomycetota bacterium]|nr:hypothetical protein [Actinomycetota bacterium]
MTSHDPAADRIPASAGSADDVRWAEADALLAGTPSEAGQRWLRRTRRVRLLVVTGLVVALGALAAVVGVLVVDGEADPPDVPTWQVVTGFVVMTAGLLGAFVALIRQRRGLRRLHAWRSPLLVLTARQRKELLAQVRGKAPVDPARVGLARLLAEGLLQGQAALGLNLGLMVMWAGQAVAQPSWWRVGVATAFMLLCAASAPFLRRDARRAQAFLDTHPPGD